jgi:hypothetical protein
MSLGKRSIYQFKASYLPVIAQFRRGNSTYSEKINIIQKTIAKDFTHGPAQLLWVGCQPGHMAQIIGDVPTRPRQERPEDETNSQSDALYEPLWQMWPQRDAQPEEPVFHGSASSGQKRLNIYH